MSDALSAAIDAAIEKVVSQHFKVQTAALEARLSALLKTANTTVDKPPNDDVKIVSLAEAGDMLGVHKITLLRWERKGYLPKRRALPGGHTGFRLDELKAFIEALPEANEGNVVSTLSVGKRKGHAHEHRR